MKSPPINNRSIVLPLTVAGILGFRCCLHSMDVPSIPELSVSGLNELRFADGYDISDDLLPQPWKYLTNTTDVRVGIYGLYLKTRFDVEEPSLGYNPPEPVYREYFSRRTIGFEMDMFTIEAGHVSTQFGRGLTISCKEDREIEQYAILDGVYGRVQYPWLTLQGIAGRPIQWRNRPVEHLDVQVWELNTGWQPDTVLVVDAADARLRDMVAGLHTEVFLPVDKAPFSYLSSGSIGGGLVRYNTEVGPLSRTIPEPVFWYQNRATLYFPSVFINAARGDFGVSMEHAWMRGQIHDFNAMDSVRDAFDSVWTTPVGSSTYLSANAQLFGVSLLAEYKNYYYAKSEVFTKKISAFLIPPALRYQHSWHLLNKHMLSNLMGDDVGYNFMLNWPVPSGSAILTADFSYGGSHDGENRFKIRPNSTYWEAYGEWAQEVGDRLNIKVGFDYGKLDPEQQKVTFRTLGVDVEAGPFRRRHSFGLILESQLNDKPFLAEKDAAALIDLIVRTVPADSLQTYVTYNDTLEFGDLLVPDSERSRYRQYAFNLLATLSYHFAPWLSLAVTFEHEMLLEDQDYNVVTDITSNFRNYASVGMNLKPFPNHTVTLEYGSMSGGKKCTLGTCIDLPPFKGFKLTVTSML
ncbi:MAG: hypothetical protein JW913_00205 [Chitinispirillaceae bacterium]|nr:hypothetical protein [Chitinispirillaceae bacterium]